MLELPVTAELVESKAKGSPSQSGHTPSMADESSPSKIPLSSTKKFSSPNPSGRFLVTASPITSSSSTCVTSPHRKSRTVKKPPMSPGTGVRSLLKRSQPKPTLQENKQTFESHILPVLPGIYIILFFENFLIRCRENKERKSAKVTLRNE